MACVRGLLCLLFVFSGYGLSLAGSLTLLRSPHSLSRLRPFSNVLADEWAFFQRLIRSGSDDDDAAAESSAAARHAVAAHGACVGVAWRLQVMF